MPRKYTKRTGKDPALEKMLAEARRVAQALGYDSPYHYLVDQLLEPLTTVDTPEGDFDPPINYMDIHLVFTVSAEIIKLGLEAAPYLEEYLHHEDKAKRLCAINSLGRLGIPHSVQSLGQILLSDYDEEVRFFAAIALGEIGSFQATKILREALHDQSPYVRKHAAEALVKVGHGLSIQPYIELLADPDRDVRRSGVYALAKIKDPAVIPPLLACIGDNDYGIAWGAVKGLKHFPEQAYNGVMESLNGNGRYHQQIVVTLLGYFKNHRSLPTLHDFLLNNSSPKIRMMAADALGRCKAAKSIPFLMDALNDSSDEVVTAAVEALGKIGAPDIVPWLKNAMNKEGDTVPVPEVVIVKALARIKHPECPELLAKALALFSGAPRIEAAKGLARQKAIGKIDTLKKAVEKEKDKKTIYQMEKALEKLVKVRDKLVCEKKK